MKELLNTYRVMINESFKYFSNKKEKEFLKINPFGSDFKKRFVTFSLSGKMIRGSLLILSYQMFRKHISKDVVNTAIAIEIFHSSLLIHDDIMDRDVLRRGEKSIFYQYKELGDSKNFNDSYHFGESMGICSGDIGFCLSFELISKLSTDHTIKEKLLKKWTKEFTYVCLAQMQDIYFGFSKNKVTEEDILALYKNKTARYTFSLPLMAGAILAGQNDETIKKLEKFGEYLGVIFQIKDDELGLFGKKEETGKTPGSDIKEGKKTLLYFYLFNKAEGKDKNILSKIFGNKNLSSSMLIKVQSIAKKYSIMQLVDKKIIVLEKKAKELISSLNLDHNHVKLLLDLLKYNIERNK